MKTQVRELPHAIPSFPSLSRNIHTYIANKWQTYEFITDNSSRSLGAPQ